LPLLKFQPSYFYNSCASNVSVAVQAKWVVVRLFEQLHCRFCDGTLWGMGFCYQWIVCRYMYIGRI